MIFDLAIIVSICYTYYCVNPIQIKYICDYDLYNQYWNILLSIYSGIASYKIFNKIMSTSITCDGNKLINNDIHVFLFIVSKFLELGDTFFLVQRNKKLKFLHCYHHTSVLLFTTHAWEIKNPFGVYFILMNSFIHFIMYFYYAFPIKWLAHYITTIQCCQMLFGLMICLYGLNHCDKYYDSFAMGFIMYLSYFFLFCKYFYKRYIMSK